MSLQAAACLPCTWRAAGTTSHPPPPAAEAWPPGCPCSATPHTLYPLQAYRKLALLKHPDKNPDNPLAADEFAALQKAYDLLLDPEARKALDNLLRCGRVGQPGEGRRPVCVDSWTAVACHRRLLFQCWLMRDGPPTGLLLPCCLLGAAPRRCGRSARPSTMRSDER